MMPNAIYEQYLLYAIDSILQFIILLLIIWMIHDNNKRIEEVKGIIKMKQINELLDNENED